jgi:hypothetical protein
MSPNDQNDPNQGKSQNINTSPIGGFNKEMDMPARSVEASIEEVKEYEVPKEVTSHVSKATETIEIPDDLRNIGVIQPHSHGLVSDTLQKELNLPLTDDQIGAGLRVDTKFSLRFLSEWSLRQLKKMHMHLSKVGMHFIRIKDTR